MAVGEYACVDPGLMRVLVRHLDYLKHRPDGGVLCKLILNALSNCRQRGYVNGSCVAHLHGLLIAYTKDLAQPYPVRIRARLIQQHLALFLPPSNHTAPVTNRSNTSKLLDPNRIRLNPSLSASSTQTAVAPPQTMTKPVSHTAKEATVHPGNAMVETPLHDPDTTVETTEKNSRQHKTQPASIEPKVGANQDVREQHSVPAVTASEIKRPDSSATPKLDELRQLWSHGVDELMREREVLAQKLSDANTYLKMIEAEREQLRADLNKARKRTRASEKPSRKYLGLPKRDILVRQLDAEVERVKRHGDPLALALIDIENMEAINNQHGHEATSAVLHHYTNEILVNFRSYDLVARYNKDEFALLLPNTDKENAMRALEKVRKRANESHFYHKGRSYPLPSFTGVLTSYTPGEDPHVMLRRADEALVNLKLRGEQRVVVI